MKILYNNINGYGSKKNSLNKIISDVQPDIIALCETKKYGKINKDDITGYAVLDMDLKQGKEGLLVAVKDKSSSSIRDISSSSNESKNILAVRIEYPLFTLRIIVVHSPQETDRCDVREEFMEEICVQIERAINCGEEFIVVGDFNARVDHINGEVVGNQMSPNGKLLSDLVNDHQLRVGNFHDKTTGKWTRIQPKKNGDIDRSTIDYVLMENKMYERLTEMTIDEQKVYCPYSVINRLGKRHVTFSDHCAIIINFDIDIGKLEKVSGSKKVWNFTEEGFLKYQNESNHDIEVEVKDSASATYACWIDAFEALLRQCFSKKSIKNSPPKRKVQHWKGVRSLLLPIAKKGKIQRAIVQEYVNRLIEKEMHFDANRRVERLKEAMKNLSEKEKVFTNRILETEKSCGKKEKERYGNNKCHESKWGRNQWQRGN